MVAKRGETLKGRAPLNSILWRRKRFFVSVRFLFGFFFFEFERFPAQCFFCAFGELIVLFPSEANSALGGGFQDCSVHMGLVYSGFQFQLFVLK